LSRPARVSSRGSITIRDLSVSDVGESGLLALIKERLAPAKPGEVWAGDDAAVVRVPRDAMLFATDAIVEKVDFDLAYASGADVGYRALAVNASDMAAMGGFPFHAVVTVGLQPDLELATFTSILDGLVDAANEMRIALVGGDITRAEELWVSVAMTGATEGDPVLRTGAQVGDAICVTGSLGGSAGGLFALQKEIRGRHHSIDEMVRRHLRPRPRIKEGLRLASLGATSMIDVSDGFALDLWRLMSASQVGCLVEPATIPRDPGLEELEMMMADSPAPLDLALRGGEDFELIFTIDRDRYQEAKMMLGEIGCPVTAVGEVTSGEKRLGDAPLQGEGQGWDHLRNR
jgi:thiamine-monophosphate kinase